MSARPVAARSVMAAIGVALLCFAAPAAACTVSSAVVVDLGSFSPSAVKAKAVPAVKSRAGLQCGFAVLKLLGSDNVKATFNSTNAFKLLRAGGGSVAYRVSADEAGVYAATQGATIDYMQNNLLNLLGLLGSSNADLPVWIKPTDDGFPPVGVYKDRISISWSWSICTGLGLVGLCALGSSDTGTGTSVIDITLIVTPRNATLSTSSTTIWDPVNKTSNPRVLPGSRRTVSTTFANPDIVALDGGPIDIVVPTPAGAVLSLDGDGALAGPAITLTEGSPASSMGLQYITPSDPSDDVDFSVDKGQSWTHQPVAGDPVSQSAVTHVRVRARGTMAAMSSFSVQIPYRIR